MNDQPSRQPRIWGAVPPRNPDFVGREELLARLHALLTEPACETTVLPAALYGIGGVGKTQIAVEYVYRFAEEYDVVWWVPTGDPAGIRSSLAGLATRLGVEPAGLDAVLAALRRDARYRTWLIVFDDAGQPDVLGAFLTAGPGHVLVTSRNADWGGFARMVEVVPSQDSAQSEPAGETAVTQSSGKPLRMSVFKATSEASSPVELTPGIGLAMDTVGYGSKPPHAQQDVQERLPAVMHRVLDDIGITFDELPSATSGDGLYLFLPPGTDPTRALPGLLPAVGTRLAEDNERYRDQLRVRMSLGFGLYGRGKLGVIGRLIIDLTRLIDSPAIRQAVLDHPRSDLVALVSRELYELVSTTRQLVPGGQSLSRVDVEMKEYEGSAWLWTSLPRH